jgi:hypothetical protein
MHYASDGRVVSTPIGEIWRFESLQAGHRD